MVLHGATGPLEPPQAQLSDVTSVLKNIAEDPGRVLVKAELSYPAVCIDGRPYRTEPGLLPQSAGGTLTTWAVDLLLTKQFQTRSLIEWLTHACEALDQSNLPVSGHRADSHGEGASGCGAADSLGPVLEMLARNPSGVRGLLEYWGIDAGLVPGSVFAEARRLSTELPAGAELINILDIHGDIPTVTGAHCEVAIIANTRQEHVVGRAALSRELTTVPGAQAFCVDLWALPAIGHFLARKGAGILTYDNEQITAVAAAFNAAALLVLCGPSAPVVVL